MLNSARVLEVLKTQNADLYAVTSHTMSSPRVINGEKPSRKVHNQDPRSARRRRRGLQKLPRAQYLPVRTGDWVKGGGFSEGKIG